MATLDAPLIVSSRAQYADSFTLARYLETGGYTALRKALTMFPEDVAHEVDIASLLGRGGAGFPAGRKWSMLRKSPVSYLVVNGDESEPATFKDHFLIERDPHQLVEGVIIAAYALQVNQAFIFLRGEFALGLERVQQALNDAYETGALGSRILDSAFSIDIVLHPGAGAYICGEDQAPFLPGRDRFVRRAHGSEQRRDDVEPAVDHQQRRRGLRGPRRRTLDGDPALRAVGARQQPRRVRGRDGEEHLS